MAPFKLHCGTNSGVAFEPAKNSHVAPQWKMLARSYWIDLQITVGKDDSSGYGMVLSRRLDPMITLRQGMVDGSASKPALKQDTGYMVEKTYLNIAPYLGAFGAYLMPQ